MRLAARFSNHTSFAARLSIYISWVRSNGSSKNARSPRLCRSRIIEHNLNRARIRPSLFQLLVVEIHARSGSILYEVVRRSQKEGFVSKLAVPLILVVHGLHVGENAFTEVFIFKLFFKIILPCSPFLLWLKAC